MKRFRGRQLTKISSDAGIKHGFRSGLEEANAQFLLDRGVPVEYEKRTLTYVQPEVTRKYTPDFILPNGIVIETKGLFTVEDRKKHLLIQGTHPFLELRFVFANANQRLYKGAKTTYGEWCRKHKFTYAHKEIPEQWLMEKPSRAWLCAAASALHWQPPVQTRSNHA